MDSKTFLTWLYEFCEGNQVETRALPARKQAFHNLGDWQAVESWCRKLKGQNLYFAVATRNGGGTKEHLGVCRRTEMIVSVRRLFFENSNRVVPKFSMEKQCGQGSCCEL